MPCFREKTTNLSGLYTVLARLAPEKRSCLSCIMSRLYGNEILLIHSTPSRKRLHPRLHIITTTDVLEVNRTDNSSAELCYFASIIIIEVTDSWYA